MAPSSTLLSEPATPPTPPVSPEVMAARRALTSLDMNRTRGADGEPVKRTRAELESIFALCLAGSPPASPTSSESTYSTTSDSDTGSPERDFALAVRRTEAETRRGRSRHVRQLGASVSAVYQDSPVPSTAHTEARKHKYVPRTRRSGAATLQPQHHALEVADDVETARNEEAGVVDNILALSSVKKTGRRLSVFEVFA